MTDTALLVAAVITSNMAVLAVVVALHVRLAADVAELRREVRGDVAEVRGDLAALRRDVASQGERLARIEGAVLGPWRPAEPDPAGEKPA